MQIDVKREKPVKGAIPGTMYIDGAFYGYTLENEAAAIPAGMFALYVRNSPKFGREKLHIAVTGRQYIMFHGANNSEELAGCIAISRTRTSEETVYGDKSDELLEKYKKATDNGDPVYFSINDAGGGGLTFPAVFALAIIGAGIYFFIKR